MKFCTHCGTPINDDTAFCPKCGQKVEEMPKMASAAETKAPKTAASAPAPAPATAAKKGSIMPALVSILLYFCIYFLNMIASVVKSIVTISKEGVFSGNVLGSLLLGQLPAFLYLFFGTGIAFIVFLIRRRSLQQSFTWWDMIPVPVFILLSMIGSAVLSSVSSLVVGQTIGSVAMVATTVSGSAVGLLLSSVFNAGVMLAIYFLRKSGAKIASIIITVVTAVFALILGFIGMVVAAPLVRQLTRIDEVVSYAVQYVCVLAPVIAVEFAMLLLGALFLGGCKKAGLWGSIGSAAGIILKISFEIIALILTINTFRLGMEGCTIAKLVGLVGVSTGVLLPLIGMIITAVKESRVTRAGSF